MKVDPLCGSGQLTSKGGGDLGPMVRCPQCGNWCGYQWNVTYHKMDCSAHDTIRDGKRWKEVIRE